MLITSRAVLTASKLHTLLPNAGSHNYGTLTSMRQHATRYKLGNNSIAACLQPSCSNECPDVSLFPSWWVRVIRRVSKGPL